MNAARMGRNCQNCHRQDLPADWLKQTLEAVEVDVYFGGFR